MPRIVTTLEFAAQSKDRMWQMMTRVYEQAARVINDQINHGSGWNSRFFDTTQTPPLLVPNHDQKTCRDNIRGAIVLCSFTAANADTLIHHNLGYIPRCYIPLWKAVTCDVYDGDGNAATLTLPPPIQPTPNYVGSGGTTPGTGVGLGIAMSDAATRKDGTSPYTTVTTSTIPLKCTVAGQEIVLLLIF